ncbi:MAG: superoxide dismutase, Ni [bacterium]|nr:superoxide dismutase, Ni [bacterium]
MFKGILKIIDRVSPPAPIYAHCDIPCGIYDPHNAQVAAHTVIRMVNLIHELKPSSEDPDLEERKKIIHAVSRYTVVKEEHAEIVKKEIRILWGDYFKPEHIEKFPQLHFLVFEIMKLASKARQEINLEAGQQLLSKLQEFSEIFWKTKEKETFRIKAPYPTEGDLVLPK